MKNIYVFIFSQHFSKKNRLYPTLLEYDFLK